MANFLLIFYIASACIDSYASEHNMMRNFKLFLMPALMAYLSFHANHDFLLYIALLLSWAGDVYLINKTKGYISKTVNSRNRINEKIIFLHVNNTEEICDLMHSFFD